MIVIIDILAVVGMIWVISYSKLLKGLREWITTKSKYIGELINCWGCMAFWLSIIYIFLPYRDYFRFIFSVVILAVILQLIIGKLKL